MARQPRWNVELEKGISMKHYTKFKSGDELDAFKAKRAVGYDSPRMRTKARLLKQGYRQRERAVLNRMVDEGLLQP